MRAPASGSDISNLVTDDTINIPLLGNSKLAKTLQNYGLPDKE
jgi:hypothetical protein